MITGTGSGFCAGFSLAERHDAPGSAGLSRSEPFRRVDERPRAHRPPHPALKAMPQPIIAAVNGPATRAGLAIALAGDVRIASTSACFSAAFIRVGISGCGLGVSWLLPRVIGAGRAFEMMLTGGPLSRGGRGNRPGGESGG